MHPRDTTARPVGRRDRSSERPAPAGAPPAGAAGLRRRGVLALAAVLALASAVRVATYPRVFTDGGVLLSADGDTYYHALRAEQIARQWPHVSWRDPGMNHPLGAEVPWPPLLDELVATAALATGDASPEHVAGVAAVVAAVLGIALVGVTAAAAAVLTGGAGWEAALLVAVLPAALRQGFLGRPDHHVLEALLSGLAFLVYAAGLGRPRSLARSAALGALLALSFWNWSGSAMYLMVLAAHVAALHLIAPRGDGAPGRAAAELARGAAIAAALLAISIAAAGPPGGLSRFGLTPITGLSVVLAALTALGAALVALARARDPGAGALRRAAHLLACIAPGAALLAAWPALRQGVLHGANAMGAATRWYESISEFWPLLLSGRQPWTRELLLALLAYGLAPLLLPLAARLLVRAWRAEPARRSALLFLAVWTVAMLGLALVRRRFEGYAAVPLAICAGWAARDLGGRLAARLRRGAAWAAWPALGVLVLAVAPTAPVSLTGAVAELPDGAAQKFPLLGWLRGAPAMPGREGVLSSWSNGHEIQWLARKPVVSTPFGTDIDPSSLLDQAQLFVSRDPSAARALLDRRRVGFLLLQSPVREVATVGPLAPGAPVLAIEERDVQTGVRYAMYPEFFDLVVSRLYFFDGTASERGGALEDYRLLGESDATDEIMGLRAQRYKLFGVVDGARLAVSGAPPGAVVRAVVRVRTNVGRDFVWNTASVADAAGGAELRVPYATGWNGLSFAEPCVVSGGGQATPARIAEPDVLLGARIAVRLGR